MKVRINTVTAFRALRRNKLRSGLSMIGIIIGISSVIAMMGLGSSAKIAVEEKIYSYGSNAMSVELKKGKQFSTSDLAVIMNYIPQIKNITPVDTTSEKNVKTIHRYRQNNLRARIYFTNADYFTIQGRTSSEGRLFTETDVKSFAKVVVIGIKVKEKLFGKTDPLGEVITINNIPFTVIGVLNKKGEALSGRDFDSMTVIPYTSGLQRFENTATFNTINLSTDYGYEIPQVKILITNHLLQKFFPGNTNPKNLIVISTSDDKLKLARDVTVALTALLAGIAAISLFVGGVGIMNIMLVSVTERTREIGIRMAIGAKKADIMLQFLLEAFFLTVIGGIGGIVLGMGLYYLIIYITEWPFIFSVFPIALAFFFSAAVGIFFGYYPSKKAAQLKPIEALKYE